MACGVNRERGRRYCLGGGGEAQSIDNVEYW